MFSTVFWIGRDCQITAVKQAACSKASVWRHQTTCHPDDFWTMVWHMWWRQTSGDGDWPQAPTCMHASDRYDGAQPCTDLNISVVSLKSTRRRTGSQCNSCRTGEMCSRRPVRVINLAAAFCTDCSRWSKSSVTPYNVRVAVVQASRDERLYYCLCSVTWQRLQCGSDLSDRLTPRGRPLTTGCQWQRPAEVACWADDADSRRQDWYTSWTVSLSMLCREHDNDDDTVITLIRNVLTNQSQIWLTDSQLRAKHSQKFSLYSYNRNTLYINVKIKTT